MVNNIIDSVVKSNTLRNIECDIVELEVVDTTIDLVVKSNTLLNIDCDSVDIEVEDDVACNNAATEEFQELEIVTKSDHISSTVSKSNKPNKDDNNSVGRRLKNRNTLKAKSSQIRRTLQWSAKEVSKNFYSKIASLKPGYKCKLCEFETAHLNRAKTHAMFCGSTRKTCGKRRKTVSCPECEQVFKSVVKKNRHFSNCHQTSMYKCTKCFKTFKLRKVYKQHLKGSGFKIMEIRLRDIVNTNLP